MAGVPPVTVLCDRFPELSETFVVSEVRALRELGLEVEVEALASPEQPAEGAAERARVWEDESTAQRLVAMAELAVRHPLACLRDLRDRRRWRREEPVPPLRFLAPAGRRVRGRHVHAHFGAGAALAAMRLSRLTGAPYSVTAHAYDIFQSPANLREKLSGAAFATTGCEYNARHLGAGVHVVVMGVDGRRFRRSRPLPGGRTVLAVGRLVEKKGFEYLAEAARLLGDEARVVIAGDGPLRDRLQGVQLLGAVPHERVRELLEEADLLCMPCVVAADGDRDSMPVVVKEALAMEVPVVASAEVGLPEVVRPGWGTLVPPRDARALADAIRAELARPPEERAARGRAGRAFVLEHADVLKETEKLAALIEGRPRAYAPTGASAPAATPAATASPPAPAPRPR